MNDSIIKSISNDLNLTMKQVNTVLEMLSEGNTVPFIARYRKEATGALDEEVIRKINEVYEYQVNLLKKKEDAIRLIDEKGLLTLDLKNNILNCTKLVEVEDLYRPFKEKKKTKATEAINNGLEPFAKMIMSFPTTGELNSIATKFLNDNVKNIDAAITGASYIIAEWISDNAFYRKAIRNNIFLNGDIVSKLKKNAIDENKVYEMYYDFKEKIKYAKSYRILAMNRGESDGILSVSLEYDLNSIKKYLESKIIKDSKSYVCDIIRNSISDSLKRLILPSIEREIRSELKEIASDVAIDNFSDNLEKLLLTPPIKEKNVLGLDPAFRTGCKLAVLDKTGKVLDIKVIYPTEPHNKIEESKEIVKNLINKYDIDVIAIGNGTASRESESFIAETIKEIDKRVEYIIVSEAGASVYSASPLAIKEFPDLTVEKRSAISIGRRLQDALSELVKIEPRSIGVGLYQHDVQPKKLDESLDFVVSKSVNSVGVNINTASISLLSYVSGLTKKSITDIIAYRDKFGKIKNREEIKKIKSINPKIYEQSIGFIRVVDGDNPLDKTGIHPESYDKTLNILKELGLSLNDLGSSLMEEKIKNVNKDLLKDKLNIDIYTLEDILVNLMKPLRDPRDEMPKPVLKSDILHIEDLKIGTKLQGTVRNVVDFGAFIDIGLKNDGLAHISKLTDRFIKHPKEVLSVGDIVNCYVIGIDLDKKKVSLSLLENN